MATGIHATLTTTSTDNEGDIIWITLPPIDPDTPVIILVLVIPLAYAIAWSLTVWPIKNGWRWSEAGRQVVCGSLLILIT